MSIPGLSNPEDTMNTAPPRSRTLVVGDNIEALARLEAGQASLAYLDPPFNSGRVFDARVAAKQPQTRTAFGDHWTWDAEAQANLKAAQTVCSRSTATLLSALVSSLGECGMSSYLAMLTPRLSLIRRAMADNGSAFIHLDPSASHYVKLILDSIFGPENFRNEIVWKRTHAHSGARRFGPVHDVLLYYTVSKEYTWNQQFTPYSDEYLAKYFRKEDERGRYQLITCTGPGARPGTRADYEWNGVRPPRDRHWAWTKEKMEQLESAGRLVHSAKSGIPRLKRYTHDGNGVRLQDIWTDINPLSSHSHERTGFETQKPIELLERIISSASNPGDLVIDAFAGSGTTAVAAERLGRSWWLADRTLLASSLTLGRIRQVSARAPIELGGFVASQNEAEQLLAADPDIFAVWASAMFGTLLQKDSMTSAMAMGVGQGNPSVQSWIELGPGAELDLPKFKPDLDRDHNLLSLRNSSAGVAEWLGQETGRPPQSHPLKDLVSEAARRQGGVDLHRAA